MPLAIAAPRILVKTKPGLTSAQLPFGGTTLAFRATPLFASAGRMQGITAPSTWYALEPATTLDSCHPWDMCHSLLQTGFGIAGAAGVEFAEPDFQQRWTI